MTQEAIQLIVYRRNGPLIVSPGALSEVGFNSLRDLLVVETQPDGLLHALETGERAVRAATALPEKERFRGSPNWKAVGAATWQEFIKGTTAVNIVRNDELTELRYLALGPEGVSLSGTTLTAELGPGTPMTDVARAVVEMFETADHTSPPLTRGRG